MVAENKKAVSKWENFHEYQLLSTHVMLYDIHSDDGLGASA